MTIEHNSRQPDIQPQPKLDTCGLPNRKYTAQEAEAEVKYLLKVAKETEKNNKLIPPEELMLSQLTPEELEEIQDLKTFPLTIFGHISTSLATDLENPLTPFSVIAIDKTLLVPELQDLVDHRYKSTKYIEVNFFKIQLLERSKRMKIFATFLEWQRMTGLKVSFTSHIGRVEQKNAHT